MNNIHVNMYIEWLIHRICIQIKHNVPVFIESALLCCLSGLNGEKSSS